MASWRSETDVVVVGSGAGGLTAALAACHAGGESIVLESAPRYGGSSAMSGGAIWVPCNSFMADLGVSDSPAQALRYLEGVTGGEVSTDRLARYVETAAPMVEALADRSRVRFEPLPTYPDYSAERDGGLPFGRTLGAVPFDGRRLGPALRELRPAHPQTGMVGIDMLRSADEGARLVGARLGDRLFAAGRFLAGALRWPPRRYYGVGPHLYMGQALVGRLRASLADLGVPVWLETRVRSLVVEGGEVTGVEAERGGERIRIRARRGVVLASGGFARNASLVEQYQRQPARVEWSAANEHNVGDVVQMARQVGAALEFMDSALWAPVTVVPGRPLAFLSVLEKCLPGGIVVDRTGRRFANEAAPFPEFARRILDRHEEVGAVPAYLVFDARFRANYPAGSALPGLMRPDWALPGGPAGRDLHRHANLGGLAEALGIDGEALQDTVERFNRMARAGKDEDFGRGDRLVERFYGDPAATPNPCLRPLERPPFYALEVFPGNLGTLGGLGADPNGQVYDTAGDPIPGLYATGNCASPIVGRTYPSSGLTLGPAMVFGFLAARHALSAAPGAKPVQRSA